MEYLCFLSPILGLLMKAKCRFSKVSAIVLPKKSGKTSLSKMLEKKNVIMVDIENSVKLHMSREDSEKLDNLERQQETQSYNNYYYPLCKKHFVELKKNFKNKNFIVLSSDAELVKYLGISNVIFLAPSNKLFTSIKNSFQDENLQKLIQSSRDSIIKYSGSKLTAFDSYEQLIAIVSSKFGLNHKL